MSNFTISVQAQEVQRALSGIRAKTGNLRPLLLRLGEGIAERAKARFGTSTGPDGQAWAPNAAATLDAYARHIGSKASNRRKSGGLNARGRKALANKRPLIGESGDLRRQIVAMADASSVTVSATTVYAAIHQFGGFAGRGHKVHIPARPFLPVTSSGALYPAERDEILETVNAWLAENMG